MHLLAGFPNSLPSHDAPAGSLCELRITGQEENELIERD